MNVKIVLFCVAVTVVSRSEGGLLRDEIKPAVETDLELTADDSDNGDWTAKLGDMEINIEHKHTKPVTNSSGIWTLDISRTVFGDDHDQKGDTEIKSKEKTEDEKLNAEVLPEENREDTKTDIEEQPDRIDDLEVYPERNTEIIPEEDVIPELYTEMSQITNDENEYPDTEKVDESMVAAEPNDENNMDNEIPIGSLNIYAPPQAAYQVRGFMPQYPNYYDSGLISDDHDNFQNIYGVGWFKLDTRNKNWPDAREACINMGAHLAVPDTKSHRSVFLYLMTTTPNFYDTQVHVGVHDPEGKGEFTTVQGKPFRPVFPIWDFNEPDNAHPGEDCVAFNDVGKIQDIPCLFERPFICEKEF